MTFNPQIVTLQWLKWLKKMANYVRSEKQNTQMTNTKYFFIFIPYGRPHMFKTTWQVPSLAVQSQIVLST